MSTLDRLFGESTSLADYASRYTVYLSELLAQLDCEAIERVGLLLEDARHAGSTIFLIGNGGSASTASHLANDLGLGPRVRGGHAYRAHSLTDNVAFMSAAGNDLGYETIFVEQLKTLMRPGDVVVAISASGNSPNVVKALEYAKQLGATTIALTGFDGGRLRQLADECVHIQTPRGDYGPVEDLHVMLGHLITTYLARLTASHAEPRSSLAPGATDETAAAVPGPSRAFHGARSAPRSGSRSSDLRQWVRFRDARSASMHGGRPGSRVPWLQVPLPKQFTATRRTLSGRPGGAPLLPRRPGCSHKVTTDGRHHPPFDTHHVRA
jgi:D-sedoheptulose 7-phosphate isomerase